jgi:two-component system response regulator YesN
MMPKLNGIDVLNEIKKTDPDMGIIIMTGYSSKDVAIEALKAHADDFIEKPMQIAGLKESIDRLLESKQKDGGVEAGGIKGKLEKVKLFVERNCFKKISLNDASQAVFMSPKYLSKIFKENIGVGFSEFKLKIKSDKAKELLEKTCLNINQISDKLGYENPESFIRQFKKFTRCTPTEYRKKSKGKIRPSAKNKKTTQKTNRKKK